MQPIPQSISLQQNPSAIFVLLGALAIGQTAAVAPLPVNKTRIPHPAIDYEGTIDINLPGLSPFTASVHASKNLVRYDGPAPSPKFLFHSFGKVCSFTIWADLETNKSVENLHYLGSDHLGNPKLPMPSFETVDVVKVADKASVDGRDMTIYRVDGGEIMPGHIFKGLIYVTPQGIVWWIKGDELNTAPGNHYSPMEIKYAGITEKKQDALYLALPDLPKTSVAANKGPR